VIISVLVHLSACTDSVRQDSPTIPKFESVAIVNLGVDNELKARFGPIDEDSNTDAGAIAGAGAGAMVGAQASLGCMGFAVLCAMAAVPAGALVGAVSGGLASYAADLPYEMSREQLLVLDDLFVQILSQRVINQDIENSLMRRMPTDRLIDKSKADTLLQYRLYDVRFFKTSPGKFALTLKTVMLFKWNRNSAQLVSTHKTYEQTSHSLEMKDWV